MRKIGLAILCLLSASCAEIPENIKPVDDFDINRYAGKWYEIARLDHRFERGLEKVTATYSLNSDGSVRVENRGYSTSKQKWSDAIGKARFAGDESTGHLEVSFFEPFYGSYVIFDLDKEHYGHAFVTGGLSTLWLLSRTPEISDQLKEKFLTMVLQAGYNPAGLIFVDQR